ncbi:class I SAM-dependent methyltransferase [Sinorhizobium numidicum]|uniref:Class I SAM-dependent methyltransferase n=1 Tax=Sinorhizobium numidicum TaxID=680248 RepID=A0ABY8CTW9_9HYPH|nr:class I SAM-dependent methyltransferase [Sinorhizobium numidicum]WEX74777.1 class I SAM-dependent methyltransferase [Sinorhizobium numidicum]WEX80770.1 class I SAM-dependent methyltransferase [Sinorhizobium numidicum]
MTSAGNGEYNRRAAFFTEEYDDRSDLRFLTGLVGNRAISVLDIPCGTGRVSMHIARRPCRIWSVDREPEMIRVLEQQAAHAGLRHRLKAAVGDMSEFDLGRRFDLIIVPREAFQLLTCRDSAARALTCFARHLKSDGRLVVDLANFRVGPTAARNLLPDYFTPDRRDGIRIYDWTRFSNGRRISRWRTQDNASNDIFRLTLDFVSADGISAPDAFTAKIGFRKYDKGQFLGLARGSSLVCIGAYGDYDLNPISATSPRMLFFLRKSGSSSKGAIP